MKGFILAAGKGTRLHPITLEIPKPLLPVNKIPIMTHLVEFLKRNGVTDIKVIINQKHEEDFWKWKATHYPASANQVKISFIVEPVQTGTFAPLATRLDESWFNEPIVVSNGDELKELDLKRMIKWHLARPEALVTLGLVQVEDAHNYGVVLHDRQGRVKGFLQKPENPPSSWIWNGLCIVEPEVRKYFETGKDFSMMEEDLFPKLAQENKLFAYRSKGRWYDCGTFERWEKAIKNWNNI